MKQISIVFVLLSMLIPFALADITVAAIGNQLATEGVLFNLPIQAADTVNGQLSVSATSTLPSWLHVSSENPLKLEGIPGAADAWQTFSASVIVTNGVDVSPPASFNIMVKPALELSRDLVRVEVNGKSYTFGGNQPVNPVVSPGDTVKVHLSFRNNFNKVLGYVKTSATLAELNGFTGLPFTSPRPWVLSPNDAGTEDFIFTVPYNLASTVPGFQVGVGLAYDNFWGEYKDNYNLDFTVQRKDATIQLISSSVNPPTLSCFSTLTLNLDLINTGAKTVRSQILVYDQQAVESSFDKVSGDFKAFAAAPKISFRSDEVLLSPGLETAKMLNINTANLSTGNYKLFVYVISPYFDQAQYFIGARAELPFTKTNCLQTFTPTDATAVIPLGTPVQFSVTLRDANAASLVSWFVDNVQAATGITQYAAAGLTAGTHTIKVLVNANQGETRSWTVTVADRPLSTNLRTNIPNDVTPEQLANFPSFTVENNFGKIVFSNPIDVRALLDLDKFISISDSTVAVDASKVAQLNQRATITLNKGFTRPMILRSNGFNSGTFDTCATAVCTIVDSSTAGKFSFTVTGFSTYKVMEQQPAAIEISEILFDQVNRGETKKLNVTIRNAGSSDALSNLHASLASVDSKYQAIIIGTLPSSLTAGEQVILQLQVTIPQTEDSGKHSIGSLQVSSDQSTKTAEISISPKSFLTIDRVEIDGKESGKLSISEPTKVEVRVRNDYSTDIKDATVTVTIFDVDNEDLDEESDQFDVAKGDTEDAKVEFDLSGDTLDKEEYTLEIKVEGKAADGTRQETVERRTVELDLKTHDIKIERASLASEIVQCSRDDVVDVTVKNMGKNDEDNVMVKVRNAVLRLDVSKSDIGLDKFSDSNNDEIERFNFDLTNAAAGTYPITVEVYRDAKLEDSKTVTLTVQDCAVQQQTTQRSTQLASDDLTRQLQQQLQQRTQQGPSPSQSIVKGSFRESQTYTILLGVLVILVFVAVVMSFLVMVFKKK